MNLFLKILFIVLFIVNFIEHKYHQYNETKPEYNCQYRKASSSINDYHGKQEK